MTRPQAADPAASGRFAGVIHHLPGIAAMLAILVGALVLLAWSVVPDALHAGAPLFGMMSPLTALAVILLGVALASARPAPPTRLRRALVRGTAIGAAALGALKLADPYLGWPALDVDRIVPLLDPALHSFSSQMAPATAAAVVALAGAIGLTTLRARAGPATHALAPFATVLAGFAASGYFFSLVAFRGTEARSYAMSLPTALVLLVLGVGALCLRPAAGVVGFLRRDDAGGMLARRLLPEILAAPFLLGILMLIGARRGWFTEPFTVALLSSAITLLLAALIAVTARGAGRADAGRVAATETLQATLRGLDAEVRERTEAARASEERYRRLVEVSPDAIFVHDGVYLTYVNPAALALFGATDESQLLGTLALDRAHPDARGVVRQRIARSIDGETSPLMEQRLLRLDGSVVHVEIIAAPLSSTAALGVQVIARDTSARKQLEAQLRQAQKMEALGRLAGGIAHDFNNMLMPILGFSELIRSQAPPDGPIAGNAREIEHAARRASDLTRQLLAFSRQRPLEPCAIDVDEVLIDFETMLRRTLGPAIVFRVVPGSGGSCILADPGQVEQILLNLAVNAGESMPDGGGLVIETATVHSEVPRDGMPKEVPAGHWVRVSVRDEGRGIDEDVRERIFDPFFTTKPQGKGTGLGLSTVHGIVRQAGGHITVESTPGEGTTVRLYLPRIEPGTTGGEPRAEVVEAPGRGGSEVILVVDDVAEVRSVLARILEAQGYVVVTAADGPAALAAFAGAVPRPRLLLSDIAMPGMRGPELARALHAQDPTLAVLFISGHPEYSAEGSADYSLAAGLLPKPVRAAELLRAVRAALDAAPPPGPSDQPPR